MKKAFTLMELVFVIVIIAIITATMLSNSKDTKLSEAAIQVVSHIRYAQHLAMIDDKFSRSDADWYKQRWRIQFNRDANSGLNWAYTIFDDSSNTHTGAVNLSEIAIDPQNPGKYLSGGVAGTATLDTTIMATFVGNSDLNLGITYGVNDDINGVTFTGACTNQGLAFDHYGRPINNRLNGYGQAYLNNGDLIQKTAAGLSCLITLFRGADNIVVVVEPETGYTHIQ